MKFSALTFAAVAQVASAHYFFESVVQNGAAGKPFEYIRDFTRQTKYNPIKFSSNPAADIRDGSTADGPDIVCNQGAATTGGKTKVLEVAAGGDVTVKLGVGARMEHPGPSLFYMSKAPGAVTSYDGSGDWFKIGEEGVCKQGADFTRDAWCSWGRDTLTATVPKDTPNGEYLLRFEHIGIHRSHVNQPEHYVSCVQVKVTGGGNGAPGPMVKFPGAYKATDPYANFSIYNGAKAFPFPGPAVWKSGGSKGGEQTTPAPAPSASAAPAPAPSASAAPAPAPAPSAAPAPAPANPPTGCNANPPVGSNANPPAGGNAKCAGMHGQCGGRAFSGAKCCSAGTCKTINPWYAQCM